VSLIKTSRLHQRYNVLAALLTAITVVGFGAVPSHAYETEKVVLVIIDGLRYSEGLGDSAHTYVPRMWSLAQEGTIIEPFLNDSLTKTRKAVPSIWCGAWTPVTFFSDSLCGGMDNRHAVMPTLFEYYRKQLSRPAEDCIYLVEEVDCVWKGSFDSEYGPAYWPGYYSIGKTDLETWQGAEQILDEHAPTLFVLYLAGVDHGGHSGDWKTYTKSIASADSVVGMLWDYLQKDSDYADKTTMFVANDHGRHESNFKRHGDGCDGCRVIQLLAIGPDIKRGYVSPVLRTIPDIVPTIGELLEFTAEQSTGTVMREIFEKQ